MHSIVFIFNRGEHYYTCNTLPNVLFVCTTKCVLKLINDLDMYMQQADYSAQSTVSESFTDNIFSIIHALYLQID